MDTYPTPRQSEALRHINASPGLTLSGLCRALGTRNISVAHGIVARLERAGLVVRRPLRITAAGRSWLGRVS